MTREDLRVFFAAIGLLVLLALMFAIAVVSFPAWAATAVITGPARVIDGDTLAIAGQHVRIAHIDAPETHQTCFNGNGVEYACGKFAAQAMARMIREAEVTCQVTGIDLYRRDVAVCGTPATPDLGREMVAHGWAVDFQKYDPRCTYCGNEKAAHDAGLGMWAGKFEMPWKWRAEHRR